MSKMIQLRYVPDEVYRKLKARAAMEGVSLSGYVLREVERLVERPTLNDLRRRLSQRKPVRPRTYPARAVRVERGRQ